MLLKFIIGASCSMVVSLLAIQLSMLSMSGAWAAVIVGTGMFTFGNLPWYGTLLSFFISSSLLSKWRKKQKRKAERMYEKTGKRDALQVLANGGLGLVFCVLYYFFSYEWLIAAFLGTMATVNADTWATEIGGISKNPRSVKTWKHVPAGTSGAVSTLGLFASVLGSLWIAMTYFLLSVVINIEDSLSLFVITMCSMGGFVGALSDSIIGSRWQAQYRCTVCLEKMEKKSHCGQPNDCISGMKWLNNDMVNVISSLIGAFVSVTVYMLLSM
ncbi:DUF92 domain-containing protein [Longirhabdus pacifica]|uniref:DUF92 domain-containing protein n=1 Tax=Longirhabdus pacifica TaxID=2305227 RepID=UPI001008A06E|nr:DUF92 domain-containing protein [Longirhabdus pacifica]